MSRLGRGLAWAYEYLKRGPCHYCGQPATTLDHKKPVSKGGKWEDGNLVGACGPCNTLKGDMDYDEFMRRRDSKAVCLGCGHFERDHKWWVDPVGSCKDSGCRCWKFSRRLTAGREA